MQFLTVVSVFVFAALVVGNPAIEREFRRVVDSNQCLKECMTPVQESRLELSIFKRSNYSDYFLKLDTICELITNARHCVDTCGIQSNPFALISMNSICSEKVREDAKILEPCLSQFGAKVSDQCVQICGDYEELNNQLHTATQTLNQEDKTAVQQFNAQNNQACGVLKCSARCTVDQFNRQCGKLSNGLMSGDLIRDTVERVLSTHRMDLQVFGLIDAVKKNTQPECNYLFTPQVLFSQSKDIESQQMVKVPENVNVEEPRLIRAQPELIPNNEQLKNSLQVRVFKKQLQVLNKQLEILNKQEQKMDESHEKSHNFEHKMEESNEIPHFMQPPPPHHFEQNEMF